MGPKKPSPVKDGKVTKKAAAAPKKKTTAATKTPTKKAPDSATKRKFVKAESFSKSDNDVQDFPTYTWRLYLESSDEPIAEVECPMPDAKDVHWCSGTGPVFAMELECMGKDGHKFVCNY